jgi:hypothetical protein
MQQDRNHAPERHAKWCIPDRSEAKLAEPTPGSPRRTQQERRQPRQQSDIHPTMVGQRDDYSGALQQLRRDPADSSCCLRATLPVGVGPLAGIAVLAPEAGNRLRSPRHKTTVI